MMQAHLVKVGMADLKVVRHTGVLKTLGLGSCIGLVLYDPVVKVAGMAHWMLPSSEIAREERINLAKYADTAIPELIRQMQSYGSLVKNLQAKLAGGAQMFALSTSDTMRIGPRNTEAAIQILGNLRIPIIAQDTGGSYGRTIEFDCITGILLVHSVQQGKKVL